MMRRLLLLAVLLLTPAPLLAQGRTFDGTDDELRSADNALASLNNAQKSVSFWITIPSAPGGLQGIVAGLRSNTPAPGWWILSANAPASAGWRVGYDIDWSTDGSWISADITAAARHHIVVTYDRGATTNDPVIYVDGTSVTVTENVAPVGTVGGGDDTIKIGELDDDSGDLSGTLSHLAIAVGDLWDAAEINRARWWGRPHGGLLVYHPFVTPKLDDEGSAAETLTATGSVMAAFVTPVVRPGSALLGGVLGW